MDWKILKKELRYHSARMAARLLSERSFLSFKCFVRNNTWPDWENPKTINDKLRWLMLYYREEKLHQFADKYLVRNYVRSRVGKKYLTKLHGVFERVEQIDFATLPDQFVLKTNHGSGWNIVCLDKSKFDEKKARRQLNRWMKRDYWAHTGEWAYKGIPRLILWEQFLCDPLQGNLPRDYKIHCFSGIPRFIQVFEDMDKELRRSIYDCDWNPSSISEGLAECKEEIEKPQNLEEMLWVARQLSQGLPYIRIDLYCIEDKIYFGEMTLNHDAASSRYKTEEMAIQIGSWLELPEKSKLEKEMSPCPNFVGKWYSKVIGKLTIGGRFDEVD